MGSSGTLAVAVDSLVFLLVFTTQIGFYVVATRELHGDWLRRMRFLPFFPLIGVGLAVNNARGVLEAFTGLRSEFVRTPKLGVLGGDRKLVKSRERIYTGGRDFWQAAVEIGLGAGYIYMAVVQAPHMLMASVATAVFSLGLFAMGGATLRALWIRRAQARSVPQAASARALEA
jgi:hypothetical protein